jgi:hypothetical protein
VGNFLRIAGAACLVLAVICLLGGLLDIPHKLGVAVLSMGFWGGLGLLLLVIAPMHNPR